MQEECTQWLEWLTSEGTSKPGWSQHLNDCESCRRHWELHHSLEQWHDATLPPPDAFEQMRARVRAQLPRKHRIAFLQWALPLAACFIGFLAGLQWSSRESAPATPDRLEDGQISSFRILSRQDNQVRVGYLVNHYVEANRSIDDPALQRMMARSLRDSPDLATRLELLDEAPTRMLPEIKQALLEVSIHDSEMVVRATAIDRLTTLEPDTQIIDAMIQILHGEKQVHLRLKALQYLVNLRQPPEKVLDTLRALEADPEPAIRVGAQDSYQLH